MRLLLVPHAPTQWNAELRFQGWTDLPLSEVGKRQAALLAKRLSNEPVDDCYASDLRRASQTAEIIVKQSGRPFIAEKRLREIHFGAWEGLTYTEFSRLHNETATAWQANPLHNAPPDGETLAEVAARVQSFFDEVRDQYQDGKTTLLVVAHRGSLRVLLCLALGLPPTAWWQFHLEPASISELALFEKGAMLKYLNDTHHLREEPDAR